MDANKKEFLRKRAFAIVLAMLCAGSGRAAVPVESSSDCAGRQRRLVRFGSAFSDGMVLQREKPVPIWGTAEPGTKLDVSFAGQSVATTAGIDGRWRVTLAPLSVSRDGRELVVSSSNQIVGQVNDQRILHDVLVGEVWLCSGQSNMKLPLWNKPCVARHANQAMDCGYLEAMMANAPLVRTCQVPCVWRKVPTELDKPLEWKRVLPGAQLHFAALPFHFAVILHHALAGVPVGVIDASWGDTKCEGFIPASGYTSVPELASLSRRPVDNVGLPGFGGTMRPNYQPRAVWNGMLAPLAPMAIRGVLWYQGAANRYDSRYGKLLQALWNGWSKEFECPDMPFYVVQLAPYGSGRSPDDPMSAKCGIWEEQAAFVRSNPSTVLVSTVDGGDNLNIHPSGKRRIALRLAAIALNRLYGRKDIHCGAPTLDRAIVEENGKVRLSFSNVTNWCMFGACDAPFELVDEDSRLLPATPEFVQGRGEIVLSAVDVKRPVAVRYMWNACWKGRLENEYGFLLAPFRVKLEYNRTNTELSPGE